MLLNAKPIYSTVVHSYRLRRDQDCKLLSKRVASWLASN